MSYLYSFSDKLYPTWWWLQQQWPKHVVDKLYTPDNTVVLWLIYPYGIITLVFSQILESEFLINLSCSPFQMKPTRCTLLLSIFISISVHVSGNYVPIIRRSYCIYVTLVFLTLYGWLSGVLVGVRPVSSQPADQTATHTNSKIPVSHRYSNFSWWWAHSCPKHVQKLK